MERSQKKPTHYPVRCPSCGDVVNLLVLNSATVTVHVHNVPTCNTTLYYLCWLERGLPLPRVEFLAPANAMEITLQPYNPRPSPADDPSLPSAPSPRFPPPPSSTSAASTREAPAGTHRPPAQRRRGR
jgi:hypothetical protein